MGGSEASDLKQQVEQGNLQGLRQYLARTRAERDWQDRIFILKLVASNIRFVALDFACDAEPQAADLFLIRCAFFAEFASIARGKGTCDQVEEGRFQNAAQNVEAAFAALQKVEKLDPDDPTAFAYILTSLTIFNQTLPQQRYAFQKATELAPDLVPAYRAIVNSLSERWHGSHQKSLDFARYAMTKAGPGSDMAVCLFWAHMLVKTHLSGFDKKPEAAKEYLHKPEVTKELEVAFDCWTQPPYTPRRSSIPYLHFAAVWFYLTGDQARLKQALSLTNNVFDRDAWSRAGNAEKAYERALLMAAGEPSPPPTQKKPQWQDSLVMIARGAKATDEAMFPEADKALSVAMALARTAPKDVGSHIIPLIMLHLSVLLQKLSRLDDARRIREQGATLLDADTELTENAKYPRQTAEVLHKLGEYRRAIPFWEQAIELTGEQTNPPAIAAMLHKISECYMQMGLRDHATVPLRAALGIHRAGPGDPRLPSVLISLGNALRTSSPIEAEALYNEAADWHTEKGHFESACTAWVNLGILYSEMGRHTESLEHYQKVLRLREQSRGTEPSRIARVLNNMANCHRKMRAFHEARSFVDRAIKLLPADDPLLANAYDTLAMILKDSGQNAEAIEWLSKARAELEKQPSPNLTSIADNLESEITLLEQLGRASEATVAEKLLASIRSKLREISQLDGDLIAAKGQGEGAVFVEIPFDTKPLPLARRSITTTLARKLSEEVKVNSVGRYCGWVSIPENATLIFYGPDAETLFTAIEPSLRTDPVSAGARVVVRQGGTHREVFISQKASRLN